MKAMPSKKTFEWFPYSVSIVQTTLLLIVVFLLTLVPASKSPVVRSTIVAGNKTLPNTAIVVQAAPTVQPDVGLPTQLKIPEIGVDAAVESVGLTSQGAMAVPKGSNDVAWFNLGPRPGEVGSAVIDGHYGWWKDGTPTVFNDLNKLNAGDKIYVTDNIGATRTFIVRRLQTYSQNESDYDVFSSSDGEAHLNLITCGGVWNAVTQSYPDRLVVFTDADNGNN
jgi:LPXTG-site transpeptidase (sortase) family protein